MSGEYTIGNEHPMDEIRDKRKITTKKRGSIKENERRKVRKMTETYKINRRNAGKG